MMHRGAPFVETPKIESTHRGIERNKASHDDPSIYIYIYIYISLTLGGICERGFGLWEGGFGTMYYHSEGSCTWGKSSRGPPRDHIPTARC